MTDPDSRLPMTEAVRAELREAEAEVLAQTLDRAPSFADGDALRVALIQATRLGRIEYLLVDLRDQLHALNAGGAHPPLMTPPTLTDDPEHEETPPDGDRD